MTTTCLETQLTPFAAAKSIVADAATCLNTESIRLSDALGRIAAEDIVAEEDLVPYPRSAMDGYALRAVDTESASPDAPVALPVTGKVFTGEGQATLAPGTALGITTGAPVPVAADAIVPWERVSTRDGTVFLEYPVRSGDCIFPPADDVRRGEVLLKRGDTVEAGRVGLLAFVGRSELPVYRRPKVTLLCTGSELVEVHETPACGQVRNSNAYTLTAMLSQCGAETRYFGIAADSRAQLRSALEAARENSDLLITTGGASVGERDLVKDVLEGLGVEFEFRRVAIRPGKPFAFSRWRGVPVCVLPGNPAAAFVCYQEFIRPLVLQMAGREKVELPVVTAGLVGGAKSKPGSRYFLFANLKISRFGFLVEPLENQCSAVVRNPAIANALIVLPEGPAAYESGDQVTVQVLNWDTVVAETSNST